MRLERVLRPKSIAAIGGLQAGRVVEQCKLMGYEGRAVVIDPDIFAAADIWELLSRDMQGKAIMCRMRSGPKGLVDRCMASSVMLLDCAQLTHWDVRKQFDQLFERTLDYQDWIGLNKEDRSKIGIFEDGGVGHPPPLEARDDGLHDAAAEEHA